VRPILSAITLALLAAVAAAAPVAIDRPAKGPAVEQKLHGAWKGQGPCDGSLGIGPDGTFERRHYGPAGITVTGTWKVRWDALPPTLVLTCKSSDDPDQVGKVWEVKLVELDDDTLAYQWPDAKKAVRYARVR
jgi:hypothetical protein